MNTQSNYHTSVFLDESIENLITNKNGIYVDATFGGGGHSRKILENINKDAKLFAFDHDEDAKKNSISDQRFVLIPENFKFIVSFLKLYNIEKIDGIIADLGVSSHHFDTPARGFSYRFDGPLDMRMDQRLEKKASDIINDYDEKQLQNIFQNFGEISNSKQLANHILKYRNGHPIITLTDLKKCLEPMVKGDPKKYWSKVFQALRIEVNNELGALEILLSQLNLILKKGGRAVFITFHSLEDRLVKQEFNRLFSESKQADYDLFGSKKNTNKIWETSFKKPLLPQKYELQNNSRSRSAKLRVATLIKMQNGK